MYSLRIPHTALLLHHRRLRRVARRTLLLSGLTLGLGQGAALLLSPLAEVSWLDLLVVGGLGLTGPLAICGLLLGGFWLREVHRGHGQRGDLVVDIEGDRLSARRPPEGAPAVDRQPILCGQAFLDYVQLTVGVLPAVQSVDLPIEPGPARDALLSAVGPRVQRLERTSGRHLLHALCVVGPAIALGLLVLKLLVVFAEVFLAFLLTNSVPAHVGLGGLAATCALALVAGAGRSLLRWLRVAPSPPRDGS